jgi:hypothetical protein
MDVVRIGRSKYNPNGDDNEKPIEHAECRPCVIPPKFMDFVTKVETPKGDDRCTGAETAAQGCTIGCQRGVRCQG